MANFGIGLAQGFNVGLSLGEALRKRRMREQFQEAQKEKPFQKYTMEQGEQMRREAGTVEQPGEYEYTIEPGSTTYTRRRRGLSAEDEAQLLAAEAARDQQGRPYYSVTRGPEGATVRGLTPTEGGGFNTIGPDTSDPRDVLNYPYISNAERLNYIGEGGYTGPQSDMRRLQSDAIAAREEEMLRPARFPVGVVPGSESTVTPGAAEYLGKTYAEMPTEAQQRSGLMNRYAQILSEYDPIEGEKFRSMARAEDRAQETFDLNKQLTQFGIKAAARTEKEAADFENISTAASKFQAENPNASPAQIVDHVRKTVKPSEATLSKFIANVVGVDQNNMTLMKNEVIRAIDRTKGSLPALIDVFNNDDRFDPSTNIVKSVDKDGKVTIKMVSAADPSKVLSSQTFNSESEAFGDLAKRATDPVNYAGWALDMQYKQSQIEANEGLGAFRRFKAAGGGVRPERDYSVSDAARVSTALTGQRNSILRQIADQDEIINGMGTKEEKDRAKKVRQALAGQVDALDVEIAEINNRLTGRGGLSRGGGGGTEPKPKVGQTYIVPNPKTGEDMQVRLKKGDGSKEEDWEILEYKRSRGGKTISGPITRPGEKLPTVDEDKNKK
jgi:hypothetical protein